MKKKKILSFFRWPVDRIRWPTLKGYDPTVSLGGGRYYIGVMTNGKIRQAIEFECSREDLELLADVIVGLLDDTELYSDGLYRAKERLP
jgi:hypothetical protein